MPHQTFESVIEAVLVDLLMQFERIVFSVEHEPSVLYSGL